MSDIHTLYVLKLEPAEGTTGNGRWYVGITKNYETRMQQHRSGCGAKCLEGKNVIDEFEIGTVEKKRDAKKFENNLTKVLAKECGWGRVRGGSFVKRKRLNLPNVDDATLSPCLREPLKETGEETLMKVAEHSELRITLADGVPFKSGEEAAEWAHNHLPDGTRYKLEFPAMSDYSTYVADSEYLEEN